MKARMTTTALAALATLAVTVPGAIAAQGAGSGGDAGGGLPVGEHPGVEQPHTRPQEMPESAADPASPRAGDPPTAGHGLQGP